MERGCAGCLAHLIIDGLILWLVIAFWPVALFLALLFLAIRLLIYFWTGD